MQADAVSCLHKKGVVHRDIKPGNIMLKVASTDTAPVPHPRAILIDFGLAFYAGSYDNAKKRCISGKVGTLGYMAPEVLSGSCYSAKVDVFSLGVVFRELMSRLSLNSESMGCNVENVSGSFFSSFFA